MKGVSHSRICTSVLWTLFFSFLLAHGDDFLEQGMCLIKLQFAIFCPIRLLFYCMNCRISVGVLRRSYEIRRYLGGECGKVSLSEVTPFDYLNSTCVYKHRVTVVPTARRCCQQDRALCCESCSSTSV